MLSLSTSAEVPVTADGCQTMNSDWPATPADLKISVPVHAGRFDSEVGAFPGLFCLKTSAASESGAWACAMRISSAKIRAALFPESAIPASFRMAAMCA